MSNEVNSLGGSDRHQQLLDHFFHRLSGQFTVHETHHSHPKMDVVAAAILTTAAPHNNETLRALSQGRDGVTDGKMVFFDQDTIVDRIRNSDFDAWFDRAMRDVVAAAQGQPTQNLQAISVSEMEQVLGAHLNPETWRAQMGYDAARRASFPVLEGLKWLDKKPVVENFGLGDFNQSAGQVFEAYVASFNAKKISNKQERLAFVKEESAKAETLELHSRGVQSFYLTSIAAQCFGVGRLDANNHGAWPGEQAEKIKVMQAFVRPETTTKQTRDRMLDVVSGTNRFSAFKDWDLLSFKNQGSRKPKP
jgi:hypothetical protein